MAIINGFQMLPFVMGMLFVWDVVAVPDPPLHLHFSSINNIMVCSEVYFS